MMETLLYEIAHGIYSSIGYWPSTLAPLFVFVIIVIWQIRAYSLNLPVLAGVLAVIPALSPSFASLLGYDYFTVLNYDLQNDRTLVVAATLLITGFCVAFLIGASLPNRVAYKVGRPRIILGLRPLIIILITVFLAVVLFFESGNILTQGYAQIMWENKSPWSSLVNQVFNGVVSVFLCYTVGRMRQRVISVFFVAMLIALLLISRRQLVISVIILWIYIFGAQKLSLKQIAALAAGFVLLQFIGVARSVGVINYLQGVRLDAAPQLVFNLPGGASHIFVSTMGVVHLLGRGILEFPDTFPLLLWPQEVYETTIYDRADYSWVGGMHIANILYWNFGLVGVVTGGLALGWITKRVHLILLRANQDLGGTLPLMLSFGFILTLPSILWYHPIGTIKLSAAILVAYVCLLLIRRPTHQKFRYSRASDVHAHR